MQGYQWYKADPAPRGAFRGRAPQTKIVPPKRGLCSEEINRLGATGVQIEAQITCFWPEKRFEFLFRPENPLEFQ